MRQSSTADGQMIIIIGFVIAMALLIIAIMLSDIIHAGSRASMEKDTRYIMEIVKKTREEVEFARKKYREDADKGKANFTKHLENFSRTIIKSYAARGKAVEIDVSGIEWKDAIISIDDRIAWCGIPGNIRWWMDDLEIKYTPYPSCSAMIENLCENPECDVRRFTVAILENPPVVYGNFSGGSCEYIEGGLDEALCRILQNWTYKGGKYLQTKGDLSCQQGSTRNIIDVLRSNVSCYGTDSRGWVMQVEPLLKNVWTGDLLTFDTISLGFDGELTAYVNSTDQANGNLVVNWTYGSGKVYYFPEISPSLRTAFNLFEPGGKCKVKVKLYDERTRHEAGITC